MRSVAEQENNESCASCGKPGTTRPVADLDNVPLCDNCAGRLFAGNLAVAHFLPDEDEPLPPPEERFKELFRAAKALFAAGVVDEDVVYPTLVFANEAWHDLDLAAARERLIATWNDATAWREEAARFTLEYKDFKPARVVENVLFLELKPVSAVIRNYQNTDVPKEAEIRVHRRAAPASSEDVSAAYAEALSDAGITSDGSDSISLDCEFREGFLWMRVKNGWEVPEEHAPAVWQGRKPQFPHPRLVGVLYQALYGNPTAGKDGFARYLNMRITGPLPQVYNFIPACAAFFLRTYGALKWREVVTQLNENILRGQHPQGVVPDKKDYPKHHSRTTQLKNDVKKVEQEFLRVAHVLYYPAE